MAWILTRLVTGKGVAVLGAAIALLLVGMWGTVKVKNIQITKKEKAITTLEEKVRLTEIKISQYRSAQESLIDSLEEITEELGRCVKLREVNKDIARKELEKQKDNINKITNKYEKIYEEYKKAQNSKNGDAPIVGDTLYELLLNARNNY